MANDYFNLTFLGIELMVLGTISEDGRNHTYLHDTLEEGKEMITLEVFSRTGLPYRTYRVTIGSKKHLIYRSAGSDLKLLEVEAAKAIQEEKDKINKFTKFIFDYKL